MEGTDMARCRTFLLVALLLLMGTAVAYAGDKERLNEWKLDSYWYDNYNARRGEPCEIEASKGLELYCWSTLGRRMSITLPESFANVLGILRPRTIFSFGSFDLRFPPEVRIRLPYDATSYIGYDLEENIVGLRLKIPF